MWSCNRILRISLILLASVCCYGQVINKNVDRTLDLSSQLVREYVKVVAEDSTGKPIREYEVIIPKNERNHLAFISVTDDEQKDLTFKEQNEDDYTRFIVAVQSANAVKNINIEAYYTKRIHPYPEEITQSSKQLVKFSGNLYFFSPYKTNSQKTAVKLSSSNIINHSQAKPFTVSSNKIKYGSFEDVAGFSNQSLFVHYENESPFITVTRLERIIEVSHWGNIAVKEHVNLEHTGAKLKGSFSRYEFQKDGRSGQSAVKSYKTLLPASAVDVYYRDTNGNISTSNMKIMRDAVEVELRPRFPLFGGWRTYYMVGYNIPSFEYLFNSNEEYLLKMRVIDHIYDDMVIDEAVVKIILPEGVSNIEIKTPYPVIRRQDELHFTYLDTVGRPVISFTKTNLIENHIANFQITYTFSKFSLLQEPILVIVFVFVIFIFVILFLRLDFSISTHSHKD